MINNGDTSQENINDDVEKFINYLEKECININKDWFSTSGFPGKSKTNNSTERYNRLKIYLKFI